MILPEPSQSLSIKKDPVFTAPRDLVFFTSEGRAGSSSFTGSACSSTGADACSVASGAAGVSADSGADFSSAGADAADLSSSGAGADSSCFLGDLASDAVNDLPGMLNFWSG